MSMSRIKNSSSNNAFGGGKEQILTTDDGKSYTIRNSSLDNFYGDGKQKTITERGSSGGLEEIIPWWIGVIIFVFCFIIQRCLA